jgi:hypothetical protein
MEAGSGDGFEARQESSPTFIAPIVLDGGPECAGLTDEDDETTGTRDGGVEEIALKEEELLGGERDNDGGEFGSLGFVDGGGIGGEAEAGAGAEAWAAAAA